MNVYLILFVVASMICYALFQDQIKLIASELHKFANEYNEQYDIVPDEDNVGGDNDIKKDK